MQIQLSQHLPKHSLKVVARSWDERLFSLPWNPLQETKTVAEPFVVRIGNALYLHPETFPYVRAFLEKYGFAYKAGDQVYEPAKIQASLWKLK